MRDSLAISSSNRKQNPQQKSVIAEYKYFTTDFKLTCSSSASQLSQSCILIGNQSMLNEFLQGGPNTSSPVFYSGNAKITTVLKQKRIINILILVAFLQMYLNSENNDINFSAFPPTSHIFKFSDSGGGNLLKIKTVKRLCGHQGKEWRGHQIWTDDDQVSPKTNSVNWRNPH